MLVITSADNDPDFRIENFVIRSIRGVYYRMQTYAKLQTTLIENVSYDSVKKMYF